MAFLDIIDAFMLYYLIGAFWSESVRISIRTIDTGHFAVSLDGFWAYQICFSMLKHITNCQSGPPVSCSEPIQPCSSHSGHPKSCRGVSLTFSSALYGLLVLDRRICWCHKIVWSSRISCAELTTTLQMPLGCVQYVSLPSLSPLLSGWF